MKVVIVDSGVNKTHPIFKNINTNICSMQYQDGYIINADKDNDSFGHGTAISGIISRNNSDVEITVIGIPDLENGLDENILIGVLNYIYEKEKPDIINLSLGVEICEYYEELYDICKKLTENGTVIISAFSNSGSISYSAAFDNVIGVTTGSSANRIGDFEYIDDTIVNIAAKGGIQRVAWAKPEYIMIGGNSFACAHVTAQAIKFIRDEKAGSMVEVLQKFKEIAVKQYIIKPFAVHSSLFSITKAAIFPFNKEMHSLIRYNSLLNFQICEVYDTKYSATVGSTTSHIMKDSSVQNIQIKNIEDIEWNNFDTLILGHTDELTSLLNRHELKNSIINEALKRNKKIYSFDDLGQYDNSNIYFPSVQYAPPSRFGMLYRISKPVLGVFGTSSRQGKFTLQLKLRQMLLEAGYNIGQIGTEPSALLYGMDYVFPMGYNSSVYIKEYETVRYLNYVLNELCMNKKDIILVGSQSGTVTYDTGSIKQYNIPQYSFLIGTQPDAVILCVNPFDEAEYIERTINFIQSCVNCKVISLVVFPMDIREDWAGIYNSKIRLSDSRYEILKCTLSDRFNIPIYKLGIEEDMRDLLKTVIDFF